jgi:hypothetical protein
MSTYDYPYRSPQQSTDQDPTDWQMEFAGAIESIFSGGTHKLEDVLGGLNASRLRPPGGGQWTKENFTTLMRELGR